MNKVPIVFTFTDDFIVPAYIAIKSLMDYASGSTEYEIIVFHYDLGRKHISELKNLVALAGHHTIKFERVDKRRFGRYPQSTHWPVIVYIRLFLPELLETYDKVIYSDVDVLFQGDLSDVFQMNMEGYDWGGIRTEINSRNMIGHKYFENNPNKYIYMSGFMICNLKRMREGGFTDIIRDNIRKYSADLQMFDLDVLNMSSSRIKKVPFRYAIPINLYEHKNVRNTYEYSYMKNVYTYDELEEEKRKKRIIHYAGGRGKPWLILCPDRKYYQYICALPKDLEKIYKRNRMEAIRQGMVLFGKSSMAKLKSKIRG